jgi:hypothetical protein
VQAAAPPTVAVSPLVPADFDVASLRSDKAAERPFILADCPRSGSDEIVVCGHGFPRSYRLQPLPPLPADATAMEKAGQMMTLHLGPVEIGPGCSPECAGISLRIRF